jgi:hypothetical protein
MKKEALISPKNHSIGKNYNSNDSSPLRIRKKNSKPAID